MLFNQPRHHAARADQRFLIGERDGVALLNRSHSWRKARAANNGRHGDVSGTRCSIAQRLRAASGLNTRSGEIGAQFFKTSLVRDYRHFRAEFLCEFRQLFRRAIGGKRNNAPCVAVAANEVDRGIADGAGRSEERN